MTTVHALAAVDPGAELGRDVIVGPFAVVGPRVRIGDRTRIDAHAVLDGDVRIGADCHIYPHAVLGTPPQDVKYADEPTRLEMGDRNLIREFVTVHRGTPHGGGVTRIGSGVFLMAYCHVAHDNQIEDGVIVANNTQLGGHVALGRHAIVGGCSAIHQFVRVGAHGFIGGGSVVVMDVAPFCNATGNRSRLHGLNVIGLKRRGFDHDQIAAIRKAYRLTFLSGLLATEAADQIEAELVSRCTALTDFVSFLRSSERGLTR